MTINLERCVIFNVCPFKQQEDTIIGWMLLVGCYWLDVIGWMLLVGCYLHPTPHGDLLEKKI